MRRPGSWRGALLAAIAVLLLAAAPVAAQVPGAPTVSSVTEGGYQQIKVSWNSPSNTGGSAITAYDVRWTKSFVNTGRDWANATTKTNAGGADARSYTITGLEDGTP